MPWWRELYSRKDRELLEYLDYLFEHRRTCDCLEFCQECSTAEAWRERIRQQLFTTVTYPQHTIAAKKNARDKCTQK